MKKPAVLLLTVLLLWPAMAGALATPPAHARFRLGNEVFLERYRHLVAGKRVGLITNQSGVNGRGQSLVDIFAADAGINLRALYAPEHGIDGKAAAGAYVESYVHPVLGIPVYSLYGRTRRPTAAMLAGVDVLVFDMQDIGARTYTFISTMQYAMAAAREHGLPFIVLDRPNPLGGVIVEGPVLEEGYQSFLGVDILPLAHGMTIGELAQYFNRLIGAELTVVRMEGYTREMLFQDTGLTWVQTSPNIPHLASAFGYLATGLASGSGVVQADQFTWVGGAGLQSTRFAALLNGAGLPGVTFAPEDRGTLGGARLTITDYRRFNPARTGLHMLFLARSQWQFPVPRSGPAPHQRTMFDRHMGSGQVARWLEENLSPQAGEQRYQAGLQAFRKVREQYLLYGFRGEGGQPSLVVNGHNVHLPVRPFIANDRTLVPVRALAQQLGAQVTWIGQERAVVIERDGTTIRLVIGSSQAVVNGFAYRLDAAPIIRHDRAMLPVRFVSEHLGARVDWCRATYAVVVSTAGAGR
ncbi:MAG TPA: hypothetical protein DCM14_02135 [Clostridiales bacterium UBA8153]|nr:hypothetical protein [Clostridiales bacterium UBA8153]